MGKRKVTVLDFLPKEAMSAIDELGYSFLSAEGYETTNAANDEKVRQKINRQLKKRGQTLTDRYKVDMDNKKVLVWFTLESKDGPIKHSKGLTIKFADKGGTQ